MRKHFTKIVEILSSYEIPTIFVTCISDQSMAFVCNIRSEQISLISSQNEINTINLVIMV